MVLLRGDAVCAPHTNSILPYGCPQQHVWLLTDHSMLEWA